MRLDYFERLVRKRRAIDGDLAPHLPCRMSERVGDSRLSDLVGVPFAKRAARRGENHASNFNAGTTTDAL
jgi:hypothetical protein